MHWVSIEVHRLFLFLVAGCGLLLLWSMGSRALEISGCAMLASLVVVLGFSCPTVCGILAPRPGIEPVSPSLKGGFSTTGPTTREIPGKALFNLCCISNSAHPL